MCLSDFFRSFAGSNEGKVERDKLLEDADQILTKVSGGFSNTSINGSLNSIKATEDNGVYPASKN